MKHLFIILTLITVTIEDDFSSKQIQNIAEVIALNVSSEKDGFFFVANFNGVEIKEKIDFCYFSLGSGLLLELICKLLSPFRYDVKIKLRRKLTKCIKWRRENTMMCCWSFEKGFQEAHLFPTLE